jgi:hypothetical protein
MECIVSIKYGAAKCRVLDNLNTFISRTICAVLGPNALALFWAACCYRVIYPKQVAASPGSQTKQSAERGSGHVVAGEVQQTSPVREDTLDGDRSGFVCID